MSEAIITVNRLVKTYARGKLVVPASRGVDTLREALHHLDTAGIRPGDIGLHRRRLDPRHPRRVRAAGHTYLPPLS